MAQNRKEVGDNSSKTQFTRETILEAFKTENLNSVLQIAQQPDLFSQHIEMTTFPQVIALVIKAVTTNGGDWKLALKCLQKITNLTTENKLFLYAYLIQLKGIPENLLPVLVKNLRDVAQSGQVWTLFGQILQNQQLDDQQVMQVARAMELYGLPSFARFEQIKADMLKIDGKLNPCKLYRELFASFLTQNPSQNFNILALGVCHLPGVVALLVRTHGVENIVDDQALFEIFMRYGGSPFVVFPGQEKTVFAVVAEKQSFAATIALLEYTLRTGLQPDPQSVETYKKFIAVYTTFKFNENISPNIEALAQIARSHIDRFRMVMNNPYLSNAQKIRIMSVAVGLLNARTTMLCDVLNNLVDNDYLALLDQAIQLYATFSFTDDELADEATLVSISERKPEYALVILNNRSIAESSKIAVLNALASSLHLSEHAHLIQAIIQAVPEPVLEQTQKPLQFCIMQFYTQRLIQVLKQAQFFDMALPNQIDKLAMVRMMMNAIFVREPIVKYWYLNVMKLSADDMQQEQPIERVLQFCAQTNNAQLLTFFGHHQAYQKMVQQLLSGQNSEAQRPNGVHAERDRDGRAELKRTRK